MKRNGFDCATAWGGERASVSQVDSRLVVVDPGVERSTVLRDGVRDGFAILDLPNRGVGPSGGLSALAVALAGRSGIESLHILSHGSAGGMDLAAGRVDAAVLAAHPNLVASIRAALADDAEIVLYGCSVAAGREGEGFVDLLSRMTGARVTASAAPVGAAALGGDWSFLAAGDRAFEPTAIAAFPSILATFDFTTVSGGGTQQITCKSRDLI
jgi:hypothetical protein